MADDSFFLSPEWEQYFQNRGGEDVAIEVAEKWDRQTQTVTQSYVQPGPDPNAMAQQGYVGDGRGGWRPMTDMERTQWGAAQHYGGGVDRIPSGDYSISTDMSALSDLPGVGPQGSINTDMSALGNFMDIADTVQSGDGSQTPDAVDTGIPTDGGFWGIDPLTGEKIYYTGQQKEDLKNNVGPRTLGITISTESEISPEREYGEFDPDAVFGSEEWRQLMRDQGYVMGEDGFWYKPGDKDKDKDKDKDQPDIIDGETNLGSYAANTWTEGDINEALSLIYFIPDSHILNPIWGGSNKIENIRGAFAQGWTGAQIAKWWTVHKARLHFQGFVPTRWNTVGAYLRDRDEINQLLDDRGLGDVVHDVAFGFDQAKTAGGDPVGKLMEEGFDTQDLVNRLDHYFRLIESPDARHLRNAVYIGAGVELSPEQIAEVMEGTPLGEEIIAAYYDVGEVSAETALVRAGELVYHDLTDQLGNIAVSRLLKDHSDRETATQLLAAFLDRDLSLTDAVDATEEALVQMAALGQGVAGLSNDDLNRLASLGASRSDIALARTRGAFGRFGRFGGGLSAELGRRGLGRISAGDYAEAEVFGSGDAVGMLEYLRNRQSAYGDQEGAFGIEMDTVTGRFRQRSRRAR